MAEIFNLSGDVNRAYARSQQVYDDMIASGKMPADRGASASQAASAGSVEPQDTQMDILMGSHVRQLIAVFQRIPSGMTGRRVGTTATPSLGPMERRILDEQKVLTLAKELSPEHQAQAAAIADMIAQTRLDDDIRRDVRGFQGSLISV